MSRIAEAFQNGKAFIPFVTAGDPDLTVTEILVPEMARAGADIIELGIPFSDPVAEGPVIQAADERALAAGFTTDKLFAMVRRIRQKTEVPLLLMTYINPIFAYGTERFLKNAADSGVDGVIVPDMPFDEKEEIHPFVRSAGLELINMIAPTSEDRIQKIARPSEGFLYCVSSLGVTGVRSEINTNISRMISQARAVTDTPCAIGFGISTPEQAKQMAAVADGVIVGSAIVRMCAQYGKECIEPVTAYVREMKAAVTG